MDVKDLRFFVAVYELHGFAQASGRLNTVQSNVSSRIIRLEDLIGAPLFLRHRRGVLPTPRGDMLYAYAKRVLALVEEATTEVKAGKDIAA